jgi:hypothetical protein
VAEQGAVCLSNINASHSLIIAKQDVQRLYARCIHAHFPVPEGTHIDFMCVAAMDGTRMPMQKPGDDETQRPFYNGVNRMHGINNGIVSGPDGCVWAAVVNAPGENSRIWVCLSLSKSARRNDS